jgi:hypothetical protein
MKEKKTYKRNKFFLIGIIIYAAAIAGYLASILFVIISGDLFATPDLIVLSVIIFFLVGLILIYISGRPVLIKIILTLCPVILVIAVRQIYIHTHRNEREILLIPEDFRGKVHVFYDMPCGTEPEYENKSRIFRIPENGILLSQFNCEYGFSDQEYYLTDESGKRLQLSVVPFIDTSEMTFIWKVYKKVKNLSEDKLAIFYIHNGSRSGGFGYTDTYGYKNIDGERVFTRIESTKDTSGYYQYKYLGFYVTTWAQFKKTYGREFYDHPEPYDGDHNSSLSYSDSLEQQFNSLEEKLIDDCVK